MKGSNLTSAGNRVVDLAALARQIALSHNAMTALLIVDNYPDGTYANRTLTVLERQVDATWKQAVAWVVLPSNVKAYDGTPIGLPGQAPNLTFLGQAVGSYSAFTFNPDGSLYGNSSPRNAYVRLASDGTPSQLADPNVRNYYDLVFTPDTGSTHVVRP